MDRKHQDGSPTAREVKYLKSMKEIFPGNYKKAIGELHLIKGVRKKELIKLLSSVYDMEENKVARSMKLVNKRNTFRGQLDKAASRRRGIRRSKGNQQRKKKRYALSKRKRRALENIEELCGICGGSKPKCKKEKTDRCKKKDPCKKKVSCRKRKRKQRPCSTPKKPTCNTRPGEQNPEKRVKREWYVPSKKTGNQAPGSSGAGSSNQNDAKETKKDGGDNSKEAAQPETQP